MLCKLSILTSRSSYLPSSFSSFPIAFLNSVSSMLRLLRLVPCSCFSLLQGFKPKVFSSFRAFSSLIKVFKDATFLATTANWTTTTTHKTTKSTLMTKFERCLLVCGSLLFLSIVLAVKIRFYFLSI